MEGKKNFIYLFYEHVVADSDGSSLPDAKYYKCWHGSRRTFELTKTMWYSLTSTWQRLISISVYIHYLTSTFRYDRTFVIEIPSYAWAILSLQARNSLPTPFEVLITTASPEVSEVDVNIHLKSLKIPMASSGIQSAFEKQVSVSDFSYSPLPDSQTIHILP